MSSQAQSSNAFAINTAPTDISNTPVTYICGDCNQKIQLKKGDQVRCPHCGYRVLYKERTKRIVQFEAR